MMFWYMSQIHLTLPFLFPQVPLLENIQYPVYHEGATTILSVYVRM